MNKLKIKTTSFNNNKKLQSETHVYYYKTKSSHNTKSAPDDIDFFKFLNIFHNGEKDLFCVPDMFNSSANGNLLMQWEIF